MTPDVDPRDWRQVLPSANPAWRDHVPTNASPYLLTAYQAPKGDTVKKGDRRLRVVAPTSDAVLRRLRAAVAADRRRAFVNAAVVRALDELDRTKEPCPCSD